MLSPLYGQLSPLRVPTSMRRVSDDNDANAYLLAVESADGQELESGVISAVEAFITGCKSDGIWTALKASCILAGARTLSGALVPLVGTAPTNFNFVTGDYSRTTGLLGNASTKYLNANRNANADPQDNYHLGVYVTSAPTITVNRSFIGNTVAYTFVDSATSGSINHRCRTSTSRNAGSATSLGYKGVSRSASASYIIRSSPTNSTQTLASTATPSADTQVFRKGGANTDARLSFYSIGESLDLALLDTRVSTLMSDLAAAIP